MDLIGPRGSAVTIRGYDNDLTYDAPGGVTGTAVATFRASQSGTYVVSATPTEPGGKLAVGESVAADLTIPLLGSGAVVIVASGVAVTIATQAAENR